MGKNKKINCWLIIAILVIALIFFFNSKEKKPLENLTQTVANPFAKVFSGAGYWFKNKFAFLVHIGEMKSENERLSNENLKLKFEISQLKETENENKVLRNEINLMAKSEFKTEASLVIGRTLSKNKKVIFLDKGEKSGIKEGDPVVVAGGVLVGRISQVHTVTSEVELILDKNNKINTEIQESGVKGIVQGEYGTSVVMDMIPQAANIESNQTVITSGLGGALPRGLLIGYVKEVSVTVDQLFQKASLDLPVQFNDLRLVWVIIS